MKYHKIKRIGEIDVLFHIRRNYQRQLHIMENDPNKDTQAADLVDQIDRIDNTLLANIPQHFHNQVKQL